MKKENCQYCFEEEKNCVCHWNTCAECGKRIPDSHASEYRGRIWCESEHVIKVREPEILKKYESR